MICRYCHKVIIPEFDAPTGLYIEAEEDTFIVHEHCLHEIQGELRKLKKRPRKAASYLVKLGKKMSEG